MKLNGTGPSWLPHIRKEMASSQFLHIRTSTTSLGSSKWLTLGLQVEAASVIRASVGRCCLNGLVGRSVRGPNGVRTVPGMLGCSKAVAQTGSNPGCPFLTLVKSREPFISFLAASCRSSRTYIHKMLAPAPQSIGALPLECPQVCWVVLTVLVLRLLLPLW